MQKFLFLIAVVGVSMVSCSPVRYFTKSQRTLLSDTALAGAHVGISIYDPAANKYLYNYQGDKYFVPASNTKLFTCYAAMKYLGDSLVAARYQQVGNYLLIKPTGDPTFLHPDFDYQPFLKLIQATGDSILISLFNQVNKYGPGWSWDDYEADYMPERSQLPIYGNVVWFNQKPSYPGNLTKDTIVNSAVFVGKSATWVKPSFFASTLNTGVFENDNFFFRRKFNDNMFYAEKSTAKFSQQSIPFITDNGVTAVHLIESITRKKVGRGDAFVGNKLFTLRSQPTDSLLKPMMHRSDNFFAEQSLLMVSNEKLGYMNDEVIIDTLLKNDLKDLPQKPVWVDGSGLSRYNQFTPQDIVTLLLKIKNEFGLNRIRNILPKGNTGTLTGYYQKTGNNIFAKTGTLSGQVALSGYLICKSKKLLLFSVMVNNHNSTGRGVRRAVEKFVTGIWEKN